MTLFLINFIFTLFNLGNQGYEYIRHYDFEYEKRVKSVLIQQTGSDERFPMINLNTNNGLTLSFDMLEAENDYFQYTYLHCDKDWNPSSLNKTDFIKGNMFEEIANFKYASNTYVQYTHYQFSFPTVKMMPRLAGNYILKVYRNFDEDDLVFTRKFMVINNVVKLSGTVKSATVASKRFTHQEVDFNIDANGFVMPNPFRDLHAVIVKNYSWMHASEPIKPQFASNNNYTFNYESENVISGVNEFRFFDVRGLRTFASGVKSKYFDTASTQIVVNLFEDQCRGSKVYLYWADNNGKTVYGNRDLPNIANSEDYVRVNFSLLPNDLFGANENVYVLGEFNNWMPKPEMKMKKDAKGVYRASFSLKQGYYNYYYGMEDKNGNMSFEITEGEHMETENDYRVLVYHKNQFLQYDELIGFMFLNTLNANKKE